MSQLEETKKISQLEEKTRKKAWNPKTNPKGFPVQSKHTPSDYWQRPLQKALKGKGKRERQERERERKKKEESRQCPR
jgi:hypothetical protein